MAKTCIICGKAAGSREHIFPASLGGRRTNKGIYCGDHNNAYAGLAGIITEQLSIFNALLGVVGDHSNKATSVVVKDSVSGQNLNLSKSHIEFTDPQEIYKEVKDDKTKIIMGFRNEKEAENWILEQKSKGIDVKIDGKAQKMRKHVGAVQKNIKFGGTTEGMRAVAYIAQTFLAHCFPDIARESWLDEIKNYTLNNVGSDLIWWDFDPPDNLPPNSFPLGHRVIVGQDQDRNSVFARISFFSTLNFSILFGSIPVKKSCVVITDIDPLAKAPPDDITCSRLDIALGTVVKSDNLSANLANAIQTGKAQALIQELLKRITDFELDSAAGTIMKKVGDSATLPDTDRDLLFSKIVFEEAQRVINLMQYVANDIDQRAANEMERHMAKFLKMAVRLEPSASNGLSAEAALSLEIASKALVKQLSEDCVAGILDRDRLSMLIGGGPGAAVVGKALLDRFEKYLLTGEYR